MSDTLARFIAEVTRLVERQGAGEAALLQDALVLMRGLVATDDWLPDGAAQAHPVHYQQHLLHADAHDRFSLVSFVWGPGQRTPVHDHTVWGVIGVLRGAEIAQRFVRDAQGVVLAQGEPQLLRAGEVEAVSPAIGDIHQVRNAHADQVSISVHLYGGNIGRIRRHVFVPATNEVKEFVSGYSTFGAGASTPFGTSASDMPGNGASAPAAAP